MEPVVRVTEIFRSLQGESTRAGLSLRVRPPDRLLAAVRLVRFGVRVPRRLGPAGRRSGAPRGDARDATSSR